MLIRPSFAPVSVIIPCYCSQNTIGRALNSVVSQTLRPAEIIVVDDGSTDNTLKVLRAFQNRYDDRLKVINLPANCGPSVARNLGWEISSQPYIAFLDADDSWHPKKLEIQYGWMAVHPDVVLTGHSCLWLSSGVLDIRIHERYAVRRIKKWPLLLSNPIPTRSAMLKRHLPFQFDPGKRHSEDYLLWCQIILSGYKAYRLEIPLAFIYKTPYGEGGLSSDLWTMELGELDTYVRLFRRGFINYKELIFIGSFSILKFLRRLLITRSRNIIPR